MFQNSRYSIVVNIALFLLGIYFVAAPNTALPTIVTILAVAAFCLRCMAVVLLLSRNANRRRYQQTAALGDCIHCCRHFAFDLQNAADSWCAAHRVWWFGWSLSLSSV